MAEVSFKGEKVTTVGDLPPKGKNAPELTLVSNTLEDVTLEAFNSKHKVLNVYVSLDTDVCAESVRHFHKFLKDRTDVALLNISMDLPFASGRFCDKEGLDHCTTLSAFRSSFPKDYGLLMSNGPLRGLCSRAVIVLDQDNKVVYTEQVPEITDEPSYDKVLEAL